ncbi:MAG: hypothetical protein NTU74_13845 [Deltaproteobacteria bacterium]|nr:hypothetical protein [Deltaproteobacteria bacterium]
MSPVQGRHWDAGRCFWQADIEEAANSYRELSLAAYHATDYPLMLDHARRSCSLLKTPEAVWLMACAAFLTRRFDIAMRLRNSIS